MTDDKETPRRDVELDIAHAVDVARNFMRSNVGSLESHQFRVEKVIENGRKTRYVVFCSVVPDIGADRDYYLIKVDVDSGKIVTPIGRGKKGADGTLTLNPIHVDANWTE
jgi:hypothetical protein